ncbi:MAG: hypothetical protein ABIT36_11370 [Steroidobacteraceae bacterium]
MLGSFLELGVVTTQIRESFTFYEQLGFVPAIAGDIWSHPYGVLVHGGLALGLHANLDTSPALTFVKPGVVQLARELERRGVELQVRRVEADSFNQIAFDAPGGLVVRVLEARTFSPPSTVPLRSAALGRFEQFSIPVRDPAAAAQFWSELGYPADVDEEPWPRHSIGFGRMRLALHRKTLSSEPLLVFRTQSVPASLQHFAQFSVATRKSGLGLEGEPHVLIETPEESLILLHGSTRHDLR